MSDPITTASELAKVALQDLVAEADLFAVMTYLIATDRISPFVNQGLNSSDGYGRGLTHIVLGHPASTDEELAAKAKRVATDNADDPNNDSTHYDVNQQAAIYAAAYRQAWTDFGCSSLSA